MSTFGHTFNTTTDMQVNLKAHPPPITANRVLTDISLSHLEEEVRISPHNDDLDVRVFISFADVCRIADIIRQSSW